MIAPGNMIRLLPNMRYPNEPEKNEDFGAGENSYGKYLQCQIMDVNTGKNNKKVVGFAYVRIYTELPLAINDMVTIKEILFIQKKRYNTIIGISIYEQPAMSISKNLKSEVGF